MTSPRRLGALALALAACAVAAAAGEPGSAPAAEFLFLGSYHMDNPGLDVHNTKADDVLAPGRQREIEEVARLVGRYRPPKVFVELPGSAQARMDGEFAASCHGTRPLGADEVEQLGYRIPCLAGLPGPVAVDWNGLGPFPDEDSVDYAAAVERNGQQAQRARDLRLGAARAAQDQAVLDAGSVGDMLMHLNSPKWLASNAQAYFRIGLYGSAGDPAGVHWLMLWQGRNLAIFNNIVRRTEPGDRVLVIYGAGHGNLLRQLATDSGHYRVQDTQRWLRDAPLR